MARSNGGIIGKVNKASFGKGVTTEKTSTGNITAQPGTRTVQALIIAGGGGGGNSSPLAGGMGGGGGGGYRCVEINAGAPGTNGVNSSVDCTSSSGGGGGAGSNNGSKAGNCGGSGGGSAFYAAPPANCSNGNVGGYDPIEG